MKSLWEAFETSSLINNDRARREMQSENGISRPKVWNGSSASILFEHFVVMPESRSIDRNSCGKALHLLKSVEPVTAVIKWICSMWKWRKLNNLSHNFNHNTHLVCLNGRRDHIVKTILRIQTIWLDLCECMVSTYKLACQMLPILVQLANVMKENAWFH